MGQSAPILNSGQNHLMKKLLILASLISLSACGSDGDAIVFDTTLGPRTKEQVKKLPNDLRGDKANAKVSIEVLKGEGLESEGS